MDCEERDSLYQKMNEAYRELDWLQPLMDPENLAAAKKLRTRIDRLSNALSSHCRKHRCRKGIGAWGVPVSPKAVSTSVPQDSK